MIYLNDDWNLTLHEQEQVLRRHQIPVDLHDWTQDDLLKANAVLEQAQQEKICRELSQNKFAEKEN